MKFFAQRMGSSGLSNSEVSALMDLVQPSRMVRAGGLIRRRNSHSPFTHFISSGWAGRCDDLELGSRQITNFLVPGDFCDLHEDALGPIDHDIVALTSASVGSLPAEALLGLEAAHPAIARAMWGFSLNESAILRAWITNLGRRESDARIAHLLCELFERLSRSGLAGDHSFQMPLTQQDLSDALGITAVHINRMLQRLRAMKLIHLENRVLTLLDVEGLRSLAGFEPAYLKMRAGCPAPPLRTSA
ncbi:MAG TPA: Crp/Fnr family transcriptional regulator [Sphingomicrobium sp.]